MPSIACPNCRNVYTIDSDKIGKKLACKCGARFFGTMDDCVPQDPKRVATAKADSIAHRENPVAAVDWPEGPQMAPSSFVTLACPSCGGKLNVTNDVDRFACGYCGAEHIVRRGGGIVSLAPILGSLERIEANVARIADSHSDELKCKKCGSEQVQSLKLIFEMGTSEVNTVMSESLTKPTFGTELVSSIFGDKSALASRTTNLTKTTGLSQTTAAKLAAPPQKQNLAVPGLLFVIGVLCLLAAGAAKSLWPVGVGSGLVGLSIWAAVKIDRWNRDVWPMRQEDWLRSFRCLKCGNTFLYQPTL